MTTRRLSQRQQLDTRKLDRIQQLYFIEVNRLADELAKGQISIEQWRFEMQAEIRITQTTARMAGKGTRRLSTADKAAIEGKVQEQYAYLDNWVRQLRKQEVINAQAVASRARMYGRATAHMFNEGYTASFGLPAMPAQPGVRTDCLSNCGCNWDIVMLDGSGNADSFWRRHKLDSCKTCIRREREFNPLQIRGGVIQPFNTRGINSNR